MHKAAFSLLYSKYKASGTRRPSGLSPAFSPHRQYNKVSSVLNPAAGFHISAREHLRGRRFLAGDWFDG